MKSRGKRLTHLTTALGLLVLVVAGFAAKDLAVEQWFLWELRSEDEQERKVAVEKLVEMRSVRAARPLIALLRERDRINRLGYGWQFPELSDVEKALVRIGLPAIPALVDVLKNGESITVRTLSAIGLPALPLLLEVSGHYDEQVWSLINSSLSKMGPPVVATIEGLKHKDRHVRAAVAHLLAAGQMEAAVPALIETLEDEHGFVRAAAAQALGMIAPSGRAVVPALMRLRKDERGPVRSAAVRALGRASKDALVPVFVESLRDEHRSVRAAAAGALSEMEGDSARQAIPALINALGDEIERVQGFAASALVRFGSRKAGNAQMDFLRVRRSDQVMHLMERTKRRRSR